MAVKSEKDNTVKATCSSCQRSFWATEAYRARVKAGRETSLCRDCSMDDSDDPCFVDDSKQLED